MYELYYTRLRGKVEGPFPVEELRQRAKRQRFSRLHEVSTDQLNWQPASKFPQLFPPKAEPKKRKLPTPAAEPMLEAAPESPQEADTYRLAVESTAARGPAEQAAAGAPAPIQAALARSDAVWHYTQGDEQHGPVAFSELQSLVQSGRLSADEFVWCDGLDDWIEPHQVPGLLSARSAQAAPSQQSAAVAVSTPAPAAGPRSYPPMAVASLVLGLLGWPCLVGSILAVVFGHMALRQINDSPQTLAGAGMALAGLILGYAALAVAFVGALTSLLVAILR